ncbi:MAG: FAD-dependent oxidoreductase [Oscillospiraceae bacterium]|nr:FAD-dependent oxidoreductase [Oscillospiraceae bacterium]
MSSIWSDLEFEAKHKVLDGDIKTDVLVIGGGIAGILCAYFLKENGVECMLVEAKKLCSGITKDTTAKITLQHGLFYDKMLRRDGVEKTRLYAKAQLEAIERYKMLCKEIPCGYEEKDSYVFSRSDREKIERETAALEKIGVKAELLERVDLPISVVGAVRVKNQAQFHPLKFLYGIAENLPVYENTKVVELRNGVAITNCGKIFCEKIIVATHFPFVNMHGFYFLKMYQHRSYVLALENADAVDGMYVDEDIKGMSFRMYDGKLLLGGGGHRTGKNGGNWEELRKFANRKYPQAKEITAWATQDCITLDGIPYIGKYSSATPGLYVITGFNKWGMTSAMAGALLLADLVVGEQNDFTDLFSPSGRLLHPQFVKNAAEAALGLIKPTAPRCPHMGCALTYNKQEHSWDCSCHGSRFSSAGELIDNPATDDDFSIKEKNKRK